MIKTETITYDGPGGTYEGTISYDDSLDGPRPGILVSHAWMGQGSFETEQAEKLAGLGYVGFALDLYGKGVRANDKDKAAELMNTVASDHEALVSRLHYALELLKEHPLVDGDRTAAIGYCFGGKCVLDLARSGAATLGVVSFHGILNAPGVTGEPAINAKVLALHGWDDPMVPPEQVVAFNKEMTERGADWQLHAYGHTMHAFTNPEANDPDFGTVYQADADRRSWQAMENFFAEIFA
ncbi:dienelactone hydrolase family protein [Emcibacter sp.]|uniref:dienelactone hydrolase family protein n=1 Tax=Emcibacter sp. TaxID=1979954 RepID=UPI003A928BA4